jgi:hypothetical protein
MVSVDLGEKSKVGKQLSVTLSDMAYRESAIMALGIGISHASLLRNQLEAWHESPSFASMLRRSQLNLEQKLRQGLLTEADLKLLREVGHEINL